MTSPLERTHAVLAVVIAPLALRLLPLTLTLRLCDLVPASAHNPAPPAALAARIHRWLAPGRGPWRSSCLTRAVVLYVMLRQHGYDPTLHVGVDGKPDAFDAHAWVSIGGAVVGAHRGEANVARYRALLVHRG